MTLNSGMETSDSDDDENANPNDRTHVASTAKKPRRTPGAKSTVKKARVNKGKANVDKSVNLSIQVRAMTYNTKRLRQRASSGARAACMRQPTTTSSST